MGHDSNSIPELDRFEQHAAVLANDVLGVVRQAHEAAKSKGFGDVMDFGLVNLPFAGGAAVLASKATDTLGTCSEAIEGLAAELKAAGNDYHDNDAEIGKMLDQFIGELEDK